MRLDVGCGGRRCAGFIGIDRVELPGVDIVHDLTVFPWPIPDEACNEIVLDNVIEHLPDTVGTFNELHRIAEKNCVVKITYPYWRSFGCYADPTHVRYFNEHMIEYFLRPGSTGRRENQYAFYTDKYWRLTSRKLITYPGLSWVPARALSLISRHLLDVVHAVVLEITPHK